MLARPTDHRCGPKGAFAMRRALFLVLACLVPLSAFCQQKTEKAIFAAGCFWCTEAAFQDIPGVVSAVSGYTGGSVKNPSYEQLSSGRTGHAEAVEGNFESAKVSYEKVLDVFWENHDHTAAHRQVCDSGTQNPPPIFYLIIP